MPARKAKAPPKVLPEIPPATSQFTYNQGYHYGMGDHPPQHNQLPVPVGSLNCLAGLNFVATGTMPSLLREELKDLIEKYGGKMTGNISGKTDIVIRGCEEVGPKKLQEAQSKKLPIIDQQGLFTIIAKSNPQYQAATAAAAAASTKQQQNGGTSNTNEKKTSIELSTELEIPFPDSSLYAERYRPRNLDELIGNKGPINQLKEWLLKSRKKSDKKIALISGPPGIGKTSAAVLLCKENGYTPNEYNASDVRSKKIVEQLQSIFDSKTITAEAKADKRAVIFEEIEDMGKGISVLVEFAKTAKVPIICICNNRDDKKLEPFKKEITVDVSFNYPKIEEIRDRLKFICKKENIAKSVTDKELDDIIISAKNDVRFSINMLQYWGKSLNTRKTISSSTKSNNKNDNNSKDEEIADVIQASLTVLAPEKTLDEKFEAFFYDYDQVPFYVQHNLSVPTIARQTDRELRNDYFDALDSISLGDMISTRRRENQAWELLNAEAVTTSLLPSECSNTKVFVLQIPKTYSSMKRQQKFERYVNEIGTRSSGSSPTPRAEIFDAFVSLLNLRFRQYFEKKKINELIEFLEKMGLTIEEVDHAEEMVLYDKKPSDMFDKPKKELTKEYAKRHSDDHKKVLPESEMRSLYLIRQTSGKKKSIK